VNSILLRCAAVAGALLLAFPVAAADVSRLQQVTDELATLQTVVEKLPDGRERKKLESRRALLERERDILRARQLLEAKEQALDRRRQESPAMKLQGLLRTLEPHTLPLQTRMETLSDRIHDAAARRNSFKAEAEKTAKLPAGTERDVRLSALNEQLLSATEEIEALQLQREAIGHGLALGTEVATIATRLHDEPAVPPLHLSTWWDKQRELTALDSRLVSANETARSVAERRAATADVLALAKEKLGQIDEEIALLAPQTGIFHSTPGVDRLLAAARRDKDALATRLPSVEAQNAALAEAAATTVQLTDLLGTEQTWLRERQRLLSERYLRWLAWPIAVIVTIILLFLGASRFVLPRFYKHEILVSARLANRYFMVATLFVAVAGFFLEDLRMLATTLGIVSAALVIALQDVFVSIAGWFAIVVSNKVRVGDRVEIDGDKGDVLEIELMRTTLNEIETGIGIDHPTGRIIAIPNSYIFRSRVHNSTRHHRWVWLRADITVTFETPLAEAAAVIRKALEETTAEAFAGARHDAAAFEHRYGRADAVYEPKVYCTIADSGVIFSLLAIAEYSAKATMRDRLHWRILNDFARDPRLQFAYPTHREIFSRDLSSHPAEEAPGASPGTPPIATRRATWPGTVN
jgi:small-conductance mechanosensitive channel